MDKIESLPSRNSWSNWGDRDTYILRCFWLQPMETNLICSKLKKGNLRKEDMLVLVRPQARIHLELGERLDTGPRKLSRLSSWILLLPNCLLLLLFLDTVTCAPLIIVTEKRWPCHATFAFITQSNLLQCFSISLSFHPLVLYFPISVLLLILNS